jgi:hypothetical protein
MIVVAPYAVDVHCGPRVHCEAVEDVWHHLGAEVANALALEAKVDYCKRAV